MRNFFTEDWFKKGLLILGFLAIGVMIYNQYLETKRHNLDVVNSMRLCANLNPQSTREDCANAVRRQRIPAPRDK